MTSPTSPTSPTSGISPGAFAEAPAWMVELAGAGSRMPVPGPASHRGDRARGRASAVLMLFGEDTEGPDVLLIERSAGLRAHAGQPAFPGGAVDPGDGGPVAAALREAWEETGLDPAGVEVLRVLPRRYVPPAGYLVTPVLAWWRTPSPVRVVDPGEVASVHRVPLRDLVDPAHRIAVRDGSGVPRPAFCVAGLVVWGFTAGLLDGLLALAGWERPWDRARVRDRPDSRGDNR